MSKPFIDASEVTVHHRGGVRLHPIADGVARIGLEGLIRVPWWMDEKEVPEVEALADVVAKRGDTAERILASKTPATHRHVWRFVDGRNVLVYEVIPEDEREGRPVTRSRRRKGPRPSPWPDLRTPDDCWF